MSSDRAEAESPPDDHRSHLGGDSGPPPDAPEQDAGSSRDPRVGESHPSDFEPAPAPLTELKIDPFLRDLLDGKRSPTDRETVLARRVAERHDLPMRLATKVAKKEINLQAALLIKPSAPEEEVRAPATSPSRGKVRRLAAALSLIVIVALGFQVPRARAVRDEQRKTAEARDVRKALLATEVLRDASQRPVEIVGDDARSVLIAFCRVTASPGRREPLYVTPSTPPKAGVKLGYFRDSQSPEGLQAITIERRIRTGRWATGDGTGPLVSRPVSGIPPGTPTVAVSLGGQ